jgi:hypothetical protein
VPLVLWIDHSGGIDIYSSVEAAELAVEHWAVHPGDVIVDEEGTNYRAVADKPRVRLIADGEANWDRVRRRLAAASDVLDPTGSGRALLDAVARVYGVAE